MEQQQVRKGAMAGRYDGGAMRWRHEDRLQVCANRGTFSCGYCESHARLAPRSIMPCCISRMMGVMFFRGPSLRYASASCLDVEQLVKPYSTPQRVSVSLSLVLI